MKRCTEPGCGQYPDVCARYGHRSAQADKSDWSGNAVVDLRDIAENIYYGRADEGDVDRLGDLALEVFELMGTSASLRVDFEEALTLLRRVPDLIDPRFEGKRTMTDIEAFLDKHRGFLA